MTIDRVLRLFLLAAALPVLAGAGLAGHTLWWTGQAQRLEAVVTGLEAAPATTTRDIAATWWMHVAFADPVDGSPRAARTSGSSNLWGYKAGDPVPVYWSADAPDRVAVASPFWLYLPAAMTALPGLAMMAAIAWARRRMRRWLPGL